MCMRDCMKVTCVFIQLYTGHVREFQLYSSRPLRENKFSKCFVIELMVVKKWLTAIGYAKIWLKHIWRALPPFFSYWDFGWCEQEVGLRWLLPPSALWPIWAIPTDEILKIVTRNYLRRRCTYALPINRSRIWIWNVVIWVGSNLQALLVTNDIQSMKKVLESKWMKSKNNHKPWWNKLNNENICVVNCYCHSSIKRNMNLFHSLWLWRKNLIFFFGISSIARILCMFLFWYTGITAHYTTQWAHVYRISVFRIRADKSHVWSLNRRIFLSFRKIINWLQIISFWYLWWDLFFKCKYMTNFYLLHYFYQFTIFPIIWI